MRATYRVQFHNGFRFDAAAGIATYLADLGISDMYCSPVLQAVSGSTHGYDVVDTDRIDDDLGGETGFKALLHALDLCGLGSVVDIVPNHMAAVPGENQQWWDVLRYGPTSRYAPMFDIEWRSRDSKRAGTVIAPVLTDRYGVAVENGDIAVVPDGDGFVVVYKDQRLPAAPGSVTDGPPSNADDLDAVLQRQFYRLVHWRVGREELDYRRFFSIETLVGVRQEDPRVFDATHRLIPDLAAGGGLRVDHVDGLSDPVAYLDRLRELAPAAWIGVEKILGPNETLPGWPVQGTTGYEFLNLVNGLFVDRSSEQDLSDRWCDFSGDTADYPTVLRAAKGEVMSDELAPEVSRLTEHLATVCESDRRYRDYTIRELRAAVRAVITELDVYRVYPTPGTPLDPAGEQIVRAASDRAARTPKVEAALCELIRDLLVAGGTNEGVAYDFVARFQQVSSAVMAKGAEDTAFYRYHRLVSLNEVGGDPGRFGTTREEFHGAMTRTAAAWPETMLTLATHDTKRSADVRARLNVITEMPIEWGAAVKGWSSHNERHRSGRWPDRAAEYLFYQSLVGAWPISTERMLAYMEKATREAKVDTSWIDPDPEYDSALQQFVRGALDDEEFIGSVARWMASQRIVETGRVNALAQTALLLTCPGVPDIYQGTELWDLSVVDPDNRRPVDFDARRRLLAVMAPLDAHEAMRHHADDGGVKQWLVRRILAHREAHPELYGPASGYERLGVTGRQERHVIAFARWAGGPKDLVADGRGAVVIVPRLVHRRGPADQETHVVLPDGEWWDILGGRRWSGGPAPVGDLLSDFPRRRSRTPAKRRMSHTFRVWAPRPAQVDVVLSGRRVPMRADAGDWWEVAVDDARPGTQYAFRLDGGPARADPRSAFQPEGPDGPSEVVDHDAFAWTASPPPPRALAGMVIYEIHVGTFSEAGTFDGAIDHLDHLVDLGVDAIEVMPVAEFSGNHGWGYDGVNLYAPHHAYGGPEAFKRLIDACHARGVRVFLDVVYNHLGPAGNYLPEFGPYFSAQHQTNWGAAVNLDGPGSAEVRRFVIDNACMWLTDYRLDGLRLDAVHAIVDDSPLTIHEELCDAVRACNSHAFVIAENDTNDPVLVRPADAGGFGYSAAWADDFHHAVHAVITGERSGYYEDFGTVEQLALALRQAWVYTGQRSVHRGRSWGGSPAGLPTDRFVVCDQNHDQVGNRAGGDRLGHLVDQDRVRLAAGITLLSPFVVLLFQGEEWAASSPFQYFTDHRDPALGAAVSDGRRGEFAAFGWKPEDVPDPQDPATFQRSKLRWDELSQEPHASMLNWYRELVATRRSLSLEGLTVDQARVTQDGCSITVVYDQATVIGDLAGSKIVIIPSR